MKLTTVLSLTLVVFGTTVNSQCVVQNLCDPNNPETGFAPLITCRADLSAGVIGDGQVLDSATCLNANVDTLDPIKNYLVHQNCRAQNTVNQGGFGGNEYDQFTCTMVPDLDAFFQGMASSCADSGGNFVKGTTQTTTLPPCTDM
jgi:hypothetical protein